MSLVAGTAPAPGQDTVPFGTCPVPETTPGLSVCASGRHTWIDPESARRCCNGFLRQLVVACPGRGRSCPTTPPR